jgi:hypothetical protein
VRVGVEVRRDLLSDGDGHGGGAELLAVVCGDGGGEGGGDEGELHFDGCCRLFSLKVDWKKGYRGNRFEVMKVVNVVVSKE